MRIHGDMKCAISSLVSLFDKKKNLRGVLEIMRKKLILKNCEKMHQMATVSFRNENFMRNLF